MWSFNQTQQHCGTKDGISNCYLGALWYAYGRNVKCFSTYWQTYTAMSLYDTARKDMLITGVQPQILVDKVSATSKFGDCSDLCGQGFCVLKWNTWWGWNTDSEAWEIYACNLHYSQRRRLSSVFTMVYLSHVKTLNWYPYLKKRKLSQQCYDQCYLQDGQDRMVTVRCIWDVT